MTSSAWQGQGRHPEAVVSERGPGGGGGCCRFIRVNALFRGPHFATPHPTPLDETLYLRHQLRLHPAAPL